MTLPLRALDQHAFDGGARLRRLLDPRLAGDHRERQATRCLRPTRPSSTRRPRRRRSRSSARSSTRSRASRTRKIRAAWPAAPRTTCAPRHRRHGLLRPRCEFFVFDEVSYDLAPNASHYAVDSAEGSGTPASRGSATRADRRGVLPGGAARHAARPAHAMVLTLERLGIACEFHHHGSPRAAVRDRPALRVADTHGRSGHDLQVRRQQRGTRGRQVGHVHAEADLRRQRLGHALPPVPLEGGHAADGRMSGLRGALAPSATPAGGLLAHAPALLAFCAPTTNSYRRLVPATRRRSLVYSQRNRSACIRIPMYSDSPKAKRIEFRCPSRRPRTALAPCGAPAGERGGRRGGRLGGARPELRPRACYQGVAEVSDVAERARGRASAGRCSRRSSPAPSNTASGRSRWCLPLEPAPALGAAPAPPRLPRRPASASASGRLDDAWRDVVPAGATQRGGWSSDAGRGCSRTATASRRSWARGGGGHRTRRRHRDRGDRPRPSACITHEYRGPDVRVPLPAQGAPWTPPGRGRQAPTLVVDAIMDAARTGHVSGDGIVRTLAGRSRSCTTGRAAGSRRWRSG